MLPRSFLAASVLATLPLTGATPAAAAPAVAPSACAESVTRSLDMRERVGQLLMIGVPVDSASTAVPLVSTYRVGSIFFAGRSYRSVASIRASADAVQRAARGTTGIAAHVAVDQEGGLVQSLRGPGFSTIASAERQGLLGSTTLRAQTASWSAQLRSAGITLDLAPVADTVSITPSANPPIGAVHRGYGRDPATVSRAVTAVVQGMQSQRVSATLKHFPGIGRVRYNPDVSPLASDRAATSADPNLAPFGAGIRAGAHAVMMSSAQYPNLDSTQPAVLSRRVVTGLLQQQLGFRGVVVTDDIGAAAALRALPLAQRAFRFIDAGGHLVLSVRPGDAGPLHRALLGRAQTDEAFRVRVNLAATRVVQSKVAAGLITCAD